MEEICTIIERKNKIIGGISLWKDYQTSKEEKLLQIINRIEKKIIQNNKNYK